MANIDEYLNDIETAVYGEEVRSAIHDSIQAMNEEIEVWTGLQDGSVTTSKIANGAVTKAKLGTDVNTILDAMKISIDKSNLRQLSNNWLPNTTTNNSGVVVDYDGRITMPNKQIFDKDIIIVNNNSTKHLILCTYNDDGTVNSRSTSANQKVDVPANTPFRLTVYTDGTSIVNPYSISQNVLFTFAGYATDLAFSEKRHTNLFDITNATLNKNFDGQTGNIVDASTSIITDYIAVDSDTSICMIFNHSTVFNSNTTFYKVAYYDQGKNWICTRRIYNQKIEDSNKWHNFNLNGYIRIAIDYSEGITPILKTLVIISSKAVNDNPFAVIPPKYITPIELFNYDSDNNLDGYGYQGETGDIVENSNSALTGYIPVKWDDILTLQKDGVDAIPVATYVIKLILFDKNKNWIATINRIKATPDPYYLTSPLRIDFDGYIRVQYYLKYKPLQIYTSSAVKLSDATSDERKTVDVIIFSGQSNMAGRGTAEDAPVVPYGYAFEFRAITDPTKLYPLSEPFGVAENNPDGINDGTKKTGDMVAAFAIDYYNGNGHVPIVGVSASKGGSGIDEWQPNAESGYLEDAIDRFTDCVTWLTDHGYTIRHKYLCWCQGEHDYETYTTYETRWQTMYDEFKAVGIEKCLLVRIGNTNSGDGHFTNMIQTQTEMAQTNDDIVLVSADLAGMADRGLMKDDLHYTQEAYNECGSYAGVNSSIFASKGKEPTMYDPENDNLYYSHKN